MAQQNEKKVNLFLDSGAFSATRRGAVIVLDEFIKFAKKNETHCEVIANLDVIGDGDATRRNQKKMEAEGLNPLPVYHYGEPRKHLIYYVNMNRYDYIGIGGMVPIPTDQLVPWLDEIFGEYICDEKGDPRVKVHGFGVSSLKIMLRYPWYSIDTSVWEFVASRLGSVYVPENKAGRWIYDVPPWIIGVTYRSPKKGKQGEHVESLSAGQREIVMGYFKEQGYPLGESKIRTIPPTDGEEMIEETTIKSGLCNVIQLRYELNASYYRELEKSMPEWPWPFQPERKKK